MDSTTYKLAMDGRFKMRASIYSIIDYVERDFGGTFNEAIKTGAYKVTITERVELEAPLIFADASPECTCNGEVWSACCPVCDEENTMFWAHGSTDNAWGDDSPDSEHVCDHFRELDESMDMMKFAAA